MYSSCLCLMIHAIRFIAALLSRQFCLDYKTANTASKVTWSSCRGHINILAICGVVRTKHLLVVTHKNLVKHKSPISTLFPALLLANKTTTNSSCARCMAFCSTVTFCARGNIYPRALPNGHYGPPNRSVIYLWEGAFHVLPIF
jgi:hypothetical protein